MVMKAVWTSSHHFQCSPGTAGFCLNFSLETLLRPFNSVHKVDKVKSPAPEPSLKIPVLSAQRTWNCLQTCQTLSYWWWSQPPVHWESQIVDDWVKREKFPNNYLYYIYILRCQRGTSPLGLASRIKDRVRASPHLSSLCILNTCGRKKRQSGQGVTTRQNRAANSWELLTTH